jgi:DNA-binding CsgD family transcriptional regulator
MNLTPREYKVVLLIKQAKRNKEIAEELGIGEGTVRTHMRSIFKKLKIKSRAELIIKDLKMEGKLMNHVDYVKEIITNAKFDENDDAKIDFADICEEEDVLQAAAELGYKAERATGQGSWWISK